MTCISPQSPPCCLPRPGSRTDPGYRLHESSEIGERNGPAHRQMAERTLDDDSRRMDVDDRQACNPEIHNIWADGRRRILPLTKTTIWPESRCLSCLRFARVIGGANCQRDSLDPAYPPDPFDRPLAAGSPQNGPWRRGVTRGHRLDLDRPRPSGHIVKPN